MNAKEMDRTLEMELNQEQHSKVRITPVIPRYIIFQDKNILTLQEKVNSALVNNWQLIGGLVVFPNPEYNKHEYGVKGSNKCDLEPTIFAQTMIKYE